MAYGCTMIQKSVTKNVNRTFKQKKYTLKQVEQAYNSMIKKGLIEAFLNDNNISIDEVKKMPRDMIIKILYKKVNKL